MLLPFPTGANMSQATIERFYAAFARLDAAAMQACYASAARFDDEVFSLSGPREIGGMWRMLCEATKAKGLAHWKLDVSRITDHGAHWDAHYLFSATGRLVINRIDAEFAFDSAGLITQHRDRFDFWGWSRQALGAPGWLLGWTPFLRQKVRATAAANLKRFLDKSPG
jgi:SnoaL-like domain